MSRAGLVPVIALAQQAGLADLVAEHVRPGGECGVNAPVFGEGQVEFQGETNFHEPFTVTVTGGSGAYQNVGGQLTAERTLPIVAAHMVRR